MRKNSKIKVRFLVLAVLIICTILGIRHFSYSSVDYENLLVNYENPLPHSYNVQVERFTYGFSSDYVAKIVHDDLKELMIAADDEGINLVINSAYRSYNDQKRIMKNKIEDYQNDGYSYQGAVEKAKEFVAEPGTSEHETGLAIDFGYNGNTSWQQCYDWLEENAYEFGFILRYPKDKTHITKITNEPWHYRYVGEKVAREVYESGLCFEEYLDN